MRLMSLKAICNDIQIVDDRNPKALDKDEYFRVFYPQSPGSDELVGGVYEGFFEVINEN